MNHSIFGKRLFPVWLSAIIILTSCGTAQRFRQNRYESRESDRESFVEKKDGTVIEAQDARLRTPLFRKSNIELDGETKIPTKEIEAYQDNEAYYRRVEGQFAPRIKKGLINMYMTTETHREMNMGAGSQFGPPSRTRTVVIYHLQKGNGAGTERFSSDVVRSYVQDYAPAMEFMNVYDENRRKSRTWSYINTAVTLGGLALLMTKGIDSKNNEVTTAGYVGTGLFVGGIVSGFVNKFGKTRNRKNLELAIDTYNGQVIKKKR